MTIGPEPSTRMDRISVRFGIGRGVYGKRSGSGGAPRAFAIESRKVQKDEKKRRFFE
jgi:hypothetical protein